MGFYIALSCNAISGNQNGDIFVFVAESSTSDSNAPWGKTGKVASWSAYMANESSNNYSSWYDQNGNTQIASNTFLEGTINLVDEFGQFPSNVYLAVGKYNTDDNGILLAQAPAGNSNSDIEITEFYNFDFTITSIENNNNETLPKEFKLTQNYPNPFNPTTTINYSIPRSTEYYSVQQVQLKIYDILGREVATLVNKKQSPGNYEATFDASHLIREFTFIAFKLVVSVILGRWFC